MARRSNSGGTGLAIAAVILAILSLFVPLFGVFIAWLALALVAIASLGGERALTVVTVAIAGFSSFMNPPFLVAGTFGSDYAMLSVFLICLPLVGIVVSLVLRRTWRRAE